MKYLLLSLFLVSCTPKDQTIYSGYDIICLKEDIQLDFDSNLDLQTTTTCIRSECFKIRYKKGFLGTKDILEKELTDIKNCVK